jgi:hypothetical protein
MDHNQRQGARSSGPPTIAKDPRAIGKGVDMTPSNEHLEKLEQALAQAHTTRQAPDFPSSWVYAVMRDIRLSASSPRTIEVPQLIWRAATVVAFVSMIVVGSVMAWNADRTGAGFAGLFTETPVDLGVL